MALGVLGGRCAQSVCAGEFMVADNLDYSVVQGGGFGMDRPAHCLAGSAANQTCGESHARVAPDLRAQL